MIPGLLGSFFVFASISGYQNVGAATTIAVLVASQLIPSPDAGLRSHGVTTGVVRPNLWRNFTRGRRLVGSQTLILIRGWCRLWLTVRGALRYLLYAATVMSNSGAQTLLLGVGIFPTYLRVIAQGD